MSRARSCSSSSNWAITIMNVASPFGGGGHAMFVPPSSGAGGGWQFVAPTAPAATVTAAAPQAQSSAAAGAWEIAPAAPWVAQVPPQFVQQQPAMYPQQQQQQPGSGRGGGGGDGPQPVAAAWMASPFRGGMQEAVERGAGAQLVDGAEALPPSADGEEGGGGEAEDREAGGGELTSRTAVGGRDFYETTYAADGAGAGVAGGKQQDNQQSGAATGDYYYAGGGGAESPLHSLEMWLPPSGGVAANPSCADCSFLTGLLQDAVDRVAEVQAAAERCVQFHNPAFVVGRLLSEMRPDDLDLNRTALIDAMRFSVNHWGLDEREAARQLLGATGGDLSLAPLPPPFATTGDGPEEQSPEEEDEDEKEGGEAEEENGEVGGSEGGDGGVAFPDDGQRPAFRPTCASPQLQWLTKVPTQSIWAFLTQHGFIGPLAAPDVRTVQRALRLARTPDQIERVVLVGKRRVAGEQLFGAARDNAELDALMQISRSVERGNNMRDVLSLPVPERIP